MRKCEGCGSTELVAYSNGSVTYTQQDNGKWKRGEFEEDSDKCLITCSDCGVDQGYDWIDEADED